MKKYLLLAVWLVVSSICLHAQPPVNQECGTSLLPPAAPRAANCTNASTTYLDHFRRPQHWIPDLTNNTPIKTLRVNFIICQKEDGTGHLVDSPATRDKLQDLVDSVNYRFAHSIPKGYPSTCELSYAPIGVFDTKIRIHLNDILFVPDTNLFYHHGGSAASIDALHALYPETEESFNIFWVDTVFRNSGYWGKYSNFHSTADAIFTEGVKSNFYITHETMIGHFVHEISHGLGLHHIYNGPEPRNINHFDFLGDVWGGCKEPAMVDVTNPCFDNCGIGSNPCPCTVTDPDVVCHLKASCFFNNHPDPNPLMSGKVPAFYISPLQAGRFHRALSLYDNPFVINNTQMPQYVVEETSYSSPFNITSDQTWDFSIKMYQDIVVKPGNTLTITCNVLMPLNGKIIVEPGGKLVVDGGTISCAHDGLWRGIQVWGNSSLSQSPSNQGYLIVKNEAIIEHAHEAVSLWNPGFWAETGGVVRATESTFRNNRRDVGFISYKRTTGSGFEIPNLSYFSDVTFTWDNDFRHTTPLNHVTMYKVNGVLFSGCDFMDERDDPVSEWITNENALQCGIYSIDANYTVKGKCTDWVNNCPDNIGDPDLDPSTFTNLDFGIYASNTSSTYGITVDRSIFRNNLYGVELINIQSPTIGRSQFLFDVAGNNYIGTSEYGIHAVRSKGLRIEENEFENIDVAHNTYGIVCSHLGPTEERLYKNTFANLYMGCYAQGQNRSTSGAEGLQFLCADNTLNTFDHYVTSTLWNGPLNPVFGVRTINGTASHPSGTTFTQETSALEDYNNQSLHLLAYYYYTGNPLEKPEEISPDGDLTAVFTSGQPNQNACPSLFPTYPVELELSPVLHAGLVTEFESANASLQTKQQQYNGLVNGGNTVALMQSIANLTVNNSQQLKQTLASYSPYLTEEVIKAVLDYPSSVYPHAWGYHLVAANIDVAYEHGFMSYLMTKADPMPQNYVSSIQALLDAKTRTNKFTLEAEMAELSGRRDFAVNMILTDIINDTVRDLDTLRHWMYQKNEPYFMSGIIDSYLEEGDFNAASAEINALSNSISSYPAEMQAELTSLVSFKSMLVQKLSVPGAIANLSASELQTMHNYAYDVNYGLASYQAQEILCFFYGECADRAIDISSSTQQRLVSIKEEAEEGLPALKVYPNPALDHVVVELPGNTENVELSIVTLTGQVVLQRTTASNQVIWNTKELPNGVYMVKVAFASGKKLTKKLSVSH